MNDQPEEHNHEARLAERLSQTLGAAGDGLEITTDPDAIKQRGATRRRRRRGLYSVAVVSVLGLGAGALLWAVGGDDSSVATVDEDVPEVTDVELGAESATTADVDEAVDAVEVTVAPIDDAQQTATVPSATDDSSEGVAAALGPEMFDGHLIPWQDGFLSIGTQYAPQPLPSEFADAVSELFPQEVQDLFADGLPGTIEEATALLSEAGLLDEVADVLSSNPEASQAVYSVEQPAPTVVTRFTMDGESWENVEATIPIDGYLNVTTAGGAVVVWALEEPAYGPTGPIDDPDGVRTLTVARSFDLVSWEVTNADIPAPVSNQPHVTSQVWVQSLAATPTGWIALFNTEQMIDHQALLPDDERVEPGLGYGINESEDGIEVEFWNEDTESWDTITYSWEELGVDGADLADFRNHEPAQLITGGFDGTSTIIESPTDVGYVNQLMSVGDAIIATGEGVRISNDLRNWQAILGLPDDTWISSAVPIDGGTLLTGDGQDGPRGWLLADDATLTEISMPELPDRYGLWNQGTSAAWVVQIMDESEMWEPTTLVIELDGLSIELTQGPDGQHAVVTDVSSGEIVLDRRWEHDDADVGELYETNEETGESAIVLRNQAGDEVVRIPGDVLDDAYRDQRPPPDEDMMAQEVPTPDFWLLATGNGVDWLVQDLDDPDPEGPGFWPGQAVVNGDRVLYQTINGWTLTTL